MRPIPVMLALLLALSPGAVAFQAPASTTQPPSPAQDVSVQNGQSASAQTGQTPARTSQSAFAQSDESSGGNTTNVMTLGTDPDRTALAGSSLALGSALASDYDSVQAQLSVDSLDQQLENTNRPERKKQILNRYRYQIENRIISLKAQERQAARDFSNGTLSTAKYLWTVGRIHAQAQNIRQRVDALNDRAARTDLSFDAELVKMKLVTLEGPVRGHVVNATKGVAPRTRVHVATSENGTVMSMIRNGQYIREVFRADNRDPSDTGQMTYSSRREAETELVGPQFPWVMQIENINGARQRHYSTLGVLQFTYFHQHGRLTAYADASTEKIYRTIQRKQLVGEHSLPPESTVNSSAENLTLAVSRTYPGGPLRTEITNASGAPLQGEISIDGEPVGRTSDNGVLWTLGPAEQFRVTATYDGRTVNVTTTPTGATTPGNVTVEPVNVTSVPPRSP